ncbi:MAG: PIN domain-containing protein [Allosphingosinicella sp.]|uniref:PIN domain-containing protein n=1 Tax=Allosphingosinicella sp. TaxID=2823234 RepID=UPI00392A00AE
MNPPYTFDTNVAVYAFLAEEKSEAAASAIERSRFMSVQVLNEFASALSRKHRRSWTDIQEALVVLTAAVPVIQPIDSQAHSEAMRIAARYQLSFHDALMVTVALQGGARTIYSEDMQHGMIVDDTLRIVDPFR